MCRMDFRRDPQLPGTSVADYGSVGCLWSRSFTALPTRGNGPGRVRIELCTSGIVNKAWSVCPSESIQG